MKRFWHKYSMANGREWLVIPLTILIGMSAIFTNNWMALLLSASLIIAIIGLWEERVKRERLEKHLEDTI